MCMCDKCNDFVFHYLLDYSCRVFVSFSCFSRICTIIRSFSKNRWFQSMCGCRKFVRTCSLFSRGDLNTLRSRLVLLISVLHKLFGETFLAFSLCSFLPQLFCFCFGFKTTAKCFSISSRTVCFSLLLFVVTLVFFICFTFSALRKSSLNKSFKGVPQQGVGGTQQKEHAQNRNRRVEWGKILTLKCE